MQITVHDTRTLAKKKALYRRIVELLETPGLRPEDIFINLLQVPPENWSVGLGEAQFAPVDVGGETETSVGDIHELANMESRN